MKTLLKTVLVLAVLGMIGKACGNKPSPASPSSPETSPSKVSNHTDDAERYVLDATSASSCENYLKGKTYTGGTATLKFGYDGTASAYDGDGQLVFGGTLEIGAVKSEVSRWVYVRDMSGGGKLQFLLSADGNMMEPSSLVIYKPI